MGNNYGHAVNLKQYRRLDGKWQFVPVVKKNGKPNPKLVLINREPVSSKGGIFHLDWRKDGKRRTRPVGSSPREALAAWQLLSGVRAGGIEPEEEPVDKGRGSQSTRPCRNTSSISRTPRASGRFEPVAGNLPGCLVL